MKINKRGSSGWWPSTCLCSTCDTQQPGIIICSRSIFTWHLIRDMLSTVCCCPQPTHSRGSCHLLTYVAGWWWCIIMSHGWQWGTSPLSDYLQSSPNTTIFADDDNDDTLMGLKVIADHIEAYDDSCDGGCCLGNKGHGACSRSKGECNALSIQQYHHLSS